MKYSIIIPTFNEQENISICLDKLERIGPSNQIIVADAHSSDNTVCLAMQKKAEVVLCQKSRGLQLNRGTQNAKSDILLFLHADTILPDNAFSVLNNFFSDPKVNIGLFRLSFDYDHWFLRFCAYMSRFDSLFTSFGDQCIAVRRGFFKEIGGFSDWPIFEDVEFLQRARKKTKIYSFNSKVVTSARKFKKNGPIRQQIKNGILILKYLTKVKPECLAKEYTK